MRFQWFLIYLLTSSLLAVPDARAQGKHSSADVSTVVSVLSVHPGDKVEMDVVLNVHDGLHAQSHTPTEDYYIKCEVTPKKDQLLTWGDVQYPPGKELNLTVGKLNAYVGKNDLRVPVAISSDAKPGTKITLSGSVRFQACNDDSCFAPETATFSTDVNVVAAGQPAAANPVYPAPASPSTAPVPTTQPAAAQTGGGGGLENSTWPVAFAAAFAIGIIFNLMPCVLPVLPLKIMGFYEVSQHDRRKSVLLGAVFSSGLIASFGVLAVLVVGLRTLNWGGLFQLPWFTAAIAGVLVVMAISTFGFFTVNVPTALYSITPRHDTYVGNFLFGILTAALSTPCTFGMFVGLLAWALKQPSWVGVAAIMMVGVGMAFPYFVLSAFPEVARNFPRAGPWAEVVKQMMGFLLLATAVYFVQPFFQHILSENAFWWTLFAIMAASGVFLIIRTIQLSSHLRPRLIGFVVALLIVVPSLLIVLKLTYKPFTWIPYSEVALTQARASGSPVLIDFTATWCGNCHYVEGVVLHNSKVVGVLKHKKVLMIQADVTNSGAPAKPLLDKLNAEGAGSIPLTAIYFPAQTDPVLLKGIYSVDDLVNTLDVGKLAAGTQ